MPKGYNVDDILSEFEAKRRPRKEPEPGESAPPPKQPFKLRSFVDTAEILPQRLSENAPPPPDATRLDIPVAEAAPKPDLGRTVVIDRNSIRAAQSAPQPEPDEDNDPDEPTRGDEARRERLRKFASLTAIPPDEDMDEEDEESFMIFGGPKKERREKKPRQRKKAEVGVHGPVDEEAAPVVDEFASRGDAKLIERDLSSLKAGLMIRLVVSLAGFLVLLYLSLMAAFPESVPGSAFVSGQPSVYMGANIGIIVLLCLVSNKVVGGGILALFRLKATNDTPLAFSALASLGLGVALAVNPGPLSPGYCSFYFTSVAAGFFFNAIGKFYMIARIATNFELIQQEETTCIVPLDESLCGHLGGRSVVLPVKTKLAGDFLAISYSDDLAENLSRITAPIFLGFSAVVGLISFFIFGDGMLSLTALAAMLAMAAPLTATLCGNLPLYRASRRLSPEGGAVCGHSTLELFEESDALIVEAADLFPRGSAVLHGIKAFAEGRIDKAIVEAASIMCSTEGTLAEVFLQVIGGRRDMLGKVTQLTYEDSRGIRAMVDGEAVFIGNRELMRAHGIAAPSRDYEQKFIDEDKDILYLANAHEVTAMFVIGYHADPELTPLLEKLVDRGVMLFVKTTDPNITADRVAAAYGLRPEYVRMVPSAVAEQLPDRAVQETQPAYLLTGQGIRSCLRTVSAVHTIRGSVVAASSIQLIGMIIGYALIAFFSFMGSVGAMGFVQVLVYQLFWTVLAVIAACMGKL